MADGGFVVRFNGKEVVRCYAIAFDYDQRLYVVNNMEKHSLPDDLETITVKIEEE